MKWNHIKSLRTGNPKMPLSVPASASINETLMLATAAGAAGAVIEAMHGRNLELPACHARLCRCCVKTSGISHGYQTAAHSFNPSAWFFQDPAILAHPALVACAGCPGDPPASMMAALMLLLHACVAWKRA